MKRKRILSPAALMMFAFTLLTANLVSVFAPPVSPYIKVLPEETLNTTLTLGARYSISVYTNYGGSDIWSWQFSLTFNPAVLRGDTVANGDLITTAKHTSARFLPGTFDNTIGKLSTTGAYFAYTTTPIVTSGPGTLAYINFTVIGYGYSDIMLAEDETTKLLNPLSPPFDAIIDGSIPQGATEPPFGKDHLGHGYFNNMIFGDINRDQTVNPADLSDFSGVYGSKPTSSNWDQGDFDRDNKTDVYDLFSLGKNYGKSV